MPTKRRKLEVHRLTISGLSEQVSYARLFKRIVDAVDHRRRLVWEHGTKSHCLDRVTVSDESAALLFFSFTTGDRPDVLDTEDFEIEASPLQPNQTQVEWTHVVLENAPGSCVLVLERVQAGIWPTTLEDYLQWLLDSAAPQPLRKEFVRNQYDGIAVSLEPVADERFVEQVQSLDRVISATIRIVRPNPGWSDLESELGSEAKESDAQRAEITMAARRGKSLARDKGIVEAMERMARKKELDYARVEGERNGEHVDFTTKRLGKQAYRYFQAAENGAVSSFDAFRRMREFLRSLL